MVRPWPCRGAEPERWRYGRQRVVSGIHSPGLGEAGNRATLAREATNGALRGPAGRPEAPSHRPPRKRRREMPTSGKPAADGGSGGGDTEWKAKWRRQRWPGAEGESQVLATPRRAALAGRSPPACVPALPHPEPRATLGALGDGLRAAAAPALGPAAAVQKPPCPLQVSYFHCREF